MEQGLNCCEHVLPAINLLYSIHVQSLTQHQLMWDYFAFKN